jgi:hypothetical protein
VRFFEAKTETITSLAGKLGAASGLETGAVSNGQAAQIARGRTVL